MNLVRAELLKIRTTNLWWILAIIGFVLWALAVLVNWGSASVSDTGQPDTGDNSLTAQQARAAGQGINIAANLFTSGQFFGLLIVMLIGAIVVTNEFFHQTATTTFLTTPVRTRVVLAKLVASVIIGLIYWLAITVFNLIAAPLFLKQLGLDTYLGDPAIWRAMGLNALAFALWAILGVGAGVLIRSQLAATIVLSVLYVIGSSAAGIVFFLLERWHEWFSKLEVIVPTTASSLMISGDDLPGSPPRWVGAAVLIGYALVMGLIGTAITRRRDIS